MSAHTPGPWKLGDENNACCDVDAGPVRITLDRMDPFTGKDVISREEMLANAHLVIAAPDLLAACRAVLHWYEVDSSEFNREAAIAACRAAIASALVIDVGSKS